MRACRGYPTKVFANCRSTICPAMFFCAATNFAISTSSSVIGRSTRVSRALVWRFNTGISWLWARLPNLVFPLNNPARVTCKPLKIIVSLECGAWNSRLKATAVWASIRETTASVLAPVPKTTATLRAGNGLTLTRGKSLEVQPQSLCDTPRVPVVRAHGAISCDWVAGVLQFTFKGCQSYHHIRASSPDYGLLALRHRVLHPPRHATVRCRGG